MQDISPKPRTSALWLRSVALIAATVAAGCSSLTPQIFSEEAVSYRGDNGRYTIDKAAYENAVKLPEAYRRAAVLRGRYMQAVEEQGNAGSQLGAGLLGLSAVTLFKGATGGLNTRDAAGAGVVGTTAWAWHSTMVPPSRRELYRAGADALHCAMSAVEPLRDGDQPLGKATDAPEVKTFYGAINDLEQARAALDGAVTRWSFQKEPSFVTQEKVKPGRTRLDKSACKPIPAGADAIARSAAEEECKKLTRVVQVRATTESSTVQLAAPPAIIAVFDAADKELAAAKTQADRAQAVAKEVSGAGHLLWDRTLAIQLAVSREVEKTIPDLASVLRLGQGLRSAAFSFTGLAAFKPEIVGDLQGSATSRRATNLDKRARTDIESALVKTGNARVNLERWLRGYSGVESLNLKQTLERCEVRAAGIELTVIPGGDEQSVPLDQVIVFFVSGGVGAPLATVFSGPIPGTVRLTIEAGQFRFEFKPPTGSKVDDVFVLRFADGSDRVSRQVRVKVVAALQRQTTTIKPAEPAASDAATGTGKPTANTDVIGGPANELENLVGSNLDRLNLTPSATLEQRRQAIEKCRRDNAIDETGDTIGPKLLEAMVAGKCKAAG
jgi:hypothetical protein